MILIIEKLEVIFNKTELDIDILLSVLTSNYNCCSCMMNLTFFFNIPHLLFVVIL